MPDEIISKIRIDEQAVSKLIVMDQQLRYFTNATVILVILY